MESRSDPRIDADANTVAALTRLRKNAVPVLSRHYEQSALISASPDSVFAYVDDQTRLSSRMNRPSWRMGGGRMEIQLDNDRGQSVGSHIRLRARVFGIPLFVDEVVTKRNPPQNKVWETTDSPELLVIEHYRMGFEITPSEAASTLRVFIDYALPDKPPARWLGYLFARRSAAWCTNQMVKDALAHFAGAIPESEFLQ
jgi:polyketide cyclase/dehydrase/lipid transport protein